MVNDKWMRRSARHITACASATLGTVTPHRKSLRLLSCPRRLHGQADQLPFAARPLRHRLGGLPEIVAKLKHGFRH